MRLSFYTYSYTDRLKMPIVGCLERIAEVGYSGIDVSGTNGNSANPLSFSVSRRKLTRRTAERLKLRIEAVITHAQLTDTLSDPKRPDLDLVGSVDLAADLGATVVTFHMGGYHEGLDRKSEWKAAVTAIRRAADHAASKHVRLAVDGIWPVWINDSIEAQQRLFDDVDHESFGINFDPCYLTLMGIDPSKLAARFAKRIVHAHLKDHRGTYPKWTHLLPGAGVLAYDRIFRGLKAVGFAASASVECFTNMKFETACDECYSAMVKAAGAGGVRFARN
jgi:sugar phosphate isomerase/epimerase